MQAIHLSKWMNVSVTLLRWVTGSGAWRFYSHALSYGCGQTIRLFILLCFSAFSPAQLANEFPLPGKSLEVNLGIELTSAQLAQLPKHVFSDGSGLPEGFGTAVEGAPLYAMQCAGCHGSVGQGGKALELVGDASLLATEYPDKGIGVYWPYAPTLYEYINRSMPPETPGIFSADEMYSLIAYLLELNKLIEPGFVLNRHTLSDLQLPNRDGFTTIAR
ncbi:MAG: c-type cytochrome [Granulosicoccus sp.]